MEWIQNILRKIFIKEKVSDIKTYQKLKDVLTKEQTHKALEYYHYHINHVNKITEETDKIYEPSDIEDKNNPSIWKGEYWNWFILVVG